MGKPKVPNTISDKKMADIQRRARDAQKDMFSRKAIAQRKASALQHKKRGAS